ncbi:unnamed protein product [marine sediment metagenome]|uniref:Uncharacterized protein n=1 Tax=marine sediment metagenome TaxID=412755 RepID=X0ZK80_9ZZZZ
MDRIRFIRKKDGKLFPAKREIPGINNPKLIIKIKDTNPTRKK